MVKINRLKHQQYLDDLDKMKKQQIENKQKIKENLLNQILFNKEKQQAKKEEEDRLNESIKRISNQIIDQRELEKKMEQKRLIQEIAENRSKSIIGKKIILLTYLN